MAEDVYIGSLDGSNNDEQLIQYCKAKNCRTCSLKQLDQNPNFVNHLTGQTFVIDFKATCKTANFIYLLSCRHPECTFQYVGKSNKAVNLRLSGHRNHITNANKGNPPKYVGEHFTKLHSPNDMVIKPIQLLKSGDAVKIIEDGWMLKLSTVYPYGLNARVDTKKIVDSQVDVLSNKICVYKLFEKIPSPRTNRGSGNNSVNNIEFHVEEFVEDIRSNKNIQRNLRIKLSGLKLEDKKSVFLHSIRVLNDKFHELTPLQKYIYLTLKDLSYFYVSRNVITKKINSSTQFLVVKFTNKLIEHVNLSKILQSEIIKETLPINDTFRIPNISYSYSSTIRSQITNYRDAIFSNLNHEDMTCDCEQSIYKDRHHKHILTGNLDIVENCELKQLLSKGLNYRESQPANKPKAFKAIDEGITSYINKISTILNKPVSYFDSWKNLVISKVNGKLRKAKKYAFNNILSKPDIAAHLESLKEKYVFVPIDKASNNVAVVCKKFYLEVLSNEIQRSTNFRLVNQSEENIITYHKEFLEKMRINLNVENSKLPYLYWLPKFHKAVVGFRYITSGNTCSMKPLSVVLGIGLKYCIKAVKNQSAYNNCYLQANDFFIINNSKTVVDFLNANNYENGRKTVSTYDFQTLYTHIPHHQLQSNLKIFVERVFNIKKKKYICITKKQHFFQINNKTTCFSLQKKNLLIP